MEKMADGEQLSREPRWLPPPPNAQNRLIAFDLVASELPVTSQVGRPERRLGRLLVASPKWQAAVPASFEFWILAYFRKIALAGVAQWIECGPVNQKVARWIPSQGTCLGPQ